MINRVIDSCFSYQAQGVIRLADVGSKSSGTAVDNRAQPRETATFSAMCSATLHAPLCVLAASLPLTVLTQYGIFSVLSRHWYHNPSLPHMYTSGSTKLDGLGNWQPND